MTVLPSRALEALSFSFLSAIDLIDEAASQIRMEIDSKPESMDKLDRKLVQLKIERMALKKEKDKAKKKPRTYQLGQLLNYLLNLGRVTSGVAKQCFD